MANPVNFSESKICYKKPPPSLGEDTRKVLQQELGIPNDQLAKLNKAGVIYINT